jgi:hypothetical protein
VEGKKSLIPSEKRCFRHPGWIGWKDMNISDYNEEDQEYLASLLENFHGNFFADE